MKTIVFISSVLFLTSCLTVRKIERNCEKFEKVCVTETETQTDTIIKTKTVIEYRDTTIYVKVPGKTVIKKVPVYIKEGIVESDLSVLVTPLARSTAQVVGSKLNHELIQVDTTLRIKLENALKREKILEKQNTILKEKYVVTIQKNKPFAKFAVKWFIGSVILIIVFLTVAFFKYKNKILGI